MKGLDDATGIGKLRDQIQIHLEDYISDRQYDCRGRMGKLLLTLTALQSISWQLIEHIQSAKISEGNNIDSIVREMISGSK